MLFLAVPSYTQASFSSSSPLISSRQNPLLPTPVPWICGGLLVNRVQAEMWSVWGEGLYPARNLCQKRPILAPPQQASNLMGPAVEESTSLPASPFRVQTSSQALELKLTMRSLIPFYSSWTDGLSTPSNGYVGRFGGFHDPR